MTAATFLRANFTALALLALTARVIAQDQPAVPAPNTALAPDQKLKSIVISLDFNNATIEEATNFLRVESKRMDPDHKGFNFVISPDASTSAKPVTMELNHVTYEQALSTICQQAGVKYQLEGGVIHILSLAEKPAVPAPALPPDDKAAEATMTKLHNLIIDKINFDKLDIATVIQFLNFKSKELDPEHRGINFVLGDINPGDKVHREVTVTLENIPLADVLSYVSVQTKLQYSIGDNIVTFKP